MDPFKHILKGDYLPENIQFVCLDNKQNRIGSFKGIERTVPWNGEYFNNDKTEATTLISKNTELKRALNFKWILSFQTRLNCLYNITKITVSEADFVSHTGNI